MAALLIAEDDRGTSDAVCEYLRRAGRRVLPAYGGGEDAGSRNAVESGVPDGEDDPGGKTGFHRSPDGTAYSFKDPDHAGGMIAIPGE